MFQNRLIVLEQYFIKVQIYFLCDWLQYHDNFIFFLLFKTVDQIKSPLEGFTQ